MYSSTRTRTVLVIGVAAVLGLLAYLVWPRSSERQLETTTTTTFAATTTTTTRTVAVVSVTTTTVVISAPVETVATTTQPVPATTTSASVVAAGIESVSGDARSLIDSWRSAVSESAGIWPGYDLAAIPVVLVAVDGEGNVGAVTAFNHPDPEALGSQVRGFEIDGHRVAVVDEVADPDRLASMAPFTFFADIGGTDTFVLVGQSGVPKLEPGTPEFIAVLAHEGFHQYQFDEWVPGDLLQDFDGYDYSAANLELVLLEHRILIAAYESATLAGTERLARQFAAVRSTRHDRDGRVVLDEHQERIEGSAQYIEHRIGDAIGNIRNSANHADELVYHDAGVEDPAVFGDGIKSFFGFDRFYSSGATLLALLDRLEPSGTDVAERLGKGDSPAQLLARHVGSPDDVDALVAAARAEHDPDGRFGPAAAILSALAAGEKTDGFGGGSEVSEDEIACLEEHGLDLSAGNITIPDDIASACLDR